MKAYLIKNCLIVNEGNITAADVLIKNCFIEKIDKQISVDTNVVIIDAAGSYLFPGIIDDQVHFREPGLTHKGNIYTESRAAVAGGVTSFMEMPNTVPNALTQELLEQKYQIASQSSLANYSFFMGAANSNFDEVIKTNASSVCGIKIFMGSSTGNMLVDDNAVLEKYFKEVPMLIAVHCEDEATIRQNNAAFKNLYPVDAPAEAHALIRNTDACYKSSSMAVAMAKKFGTRLHVLHISTEKEISLFENTILLANKKITAEVCVHHLLFDTTDYARLQNLIKWNPSIKEGYNKDALLQALLDDKLDIIATDHAPHTWEEKQQGYWNTPSGGPMVQHSLSVMLDFYDQGKITLEKIVEKMCHAPAVCFQLSLRGYIREGYYADLVLVQPNKKYKVSKENIHYKCGWSALEGNVFNHTVTHTFVSGHLAYHAGEFNEATMGKRLFFER